MNDTLLIIFIIIGFAVVFPLFWCGVIMLLSGIGGWGSLAQHYRVSNVPEDKSRSSRSLQMRRRRSFSVNYNSVVQYRIDREAIYLSVFILFRPLHPTLRLPFDDMKLVEDSPRRIRIRFWQAVDVSFMREPSIEISLRKKDYDWIMDTRESLVRD